jgi:hypothetical protein
MVNEANSYTHILIDFYNDSRLYMTEEEFVNIVFKGNTKRYSQENSPETWVYFTVYMKESEKKLNDIRKYNKTSGIIDDLLR